MKPMLSVLVVVSVVACNLFGTFGPTVERIAGNYGS